jgi:hypothetical protein
MDSSKHQALPFFNISEREKGGTTSKTQDFEISTIWLQT